jgi:hypothetical protein
MYGAIIGGGASTGAAGGGPRLKRSSMRASAAGGRPPRGGAGRASAPRTASSVAFSALIEKSTLFSFRSPTAEGSCDAA